MSVRRDAQVYDGLYNDSEDDLSAGSSSEYSDDASDAGPKSCYDRIEKWDKEYEFKLADKCNIVTAVVILANTVVIGLQANGDQDPEKWAVVENFFLFFFVFELTVRIYANGIVGFFCSPPLCCPSRDSVERSEEESGEHASDASCWNLFDFIIVVSGVMDQWVLQMLRTDGKKNTFGQLLTLLRMLRILRTLRMVRMFKAVPQLYTLASGLIESMKTSLSIFVLFVLIIAVFAIFVTKAVHEDPDAEVQVYFGSWLKSSCTLFQFVTLDDWSRIARRASRIDCRNAAGVIEKCDGPPKPWLMGIFVFFVILTAFSILSLLTGVISEHMIQLSRFQDKQAEEYEERQKAEFLKRFKKMFEKADTDNSQTISREELANFIADPSVQDQLHALQKEGFEIPEFRFAENSQTKMYEGEVDMKGFEELFAAIIPQGDDEVTLDEFCQGFLRMRGGAKGIHLLELQAELRRLRNDFGLNGVEATTLGSVHEKLNGIMQVMSDVQFSLQRLEHRVGRLQHQSTSSERQMRQSHESTHDA